MGFCPYYSKDCPHSADCELYIDSECVLVAIRRLLMEILAALGA